jgi:hypothetical protein
MSEYIIDDNYRPRFRDSNGVPMNVICARCEHVNGRHCVDQSGCCHGGGECDCPGFEPAVARSGADA